MAGMTLLPEAWAKPLSLPSGAIWPSCICPEPMEGVTEGIWLTTLSEMKLVSFWMMPFIRISTGVPGKTALLRKIEPFTCSGLPLIVQLMGLHIGRIGETAKRLVDLGVRGIDINCACPMPKIISNGAGGKRLTEPNWIVEVLSHLRCVLPSTIPVSVKLRSGFVEAREMEHILPLVAQSGVDVIHFHWRTVAERYQVLGTLIRKERLIMARELTDGIPLIACGDITSVEDAVEMAELGCDGIGIARGLVKNPWLIKQCLQATQVHATNQVLQVGYGELLEFAMALVNHLKGENSKRNGKILQMLGMIFGRDEGLFRQILTCQTSQDILDRLQLEYEGIKKFGGRHETI